MARTNNAAKPLHPGEQAWVDNMVRLIYGPPDEPEGTPDGLPPCRDHGYNCLNRAAYVEWNKREDERITEMLRDRYPGYLYDGRDGSIEADEDDEDRIEAEDEAREEWSEYLEWQRSLGA
jgi:hypothetical protein